MARSWTGLMPMIWWTSACLSVGMVLCLSSLVPAAGTPGGNLPCHGVFARLSARDRPGSGAVDGRVVRIAGLYSDQLVDLVPDFVAFSAADPCGQSVGLAFGL